MNTDVTRFLDRHYPGKHKRVESGEHCFPCPNCGDSDSCSINVSTGQYVCFRAACDGKGNLYTLKTKLGLAYKISVKDSSTAEEYAAERLAETFSRKQRYPMKDWNSKLINDPRCKGARDYIIGDRCISAEILELALIGWVRCPPPGKSGRKWKVRKQGPGSLGMLSIPYFQGESKTPVNIKLRWVPPEPQMKRPSGKLKTLRYQRVAGGASLLYAPTGIHPKVPMLLVGGEIDALSVLQALKTSGCDPLDLESAGFFVVSVPNGEGAWDDVFGEQIKHVEDITIALDNDPAGVIGANKLAKHIGKHRCKIAQWPGKHKDANDALKVDELDYFDLIGMIENGKQVAVDGIVSAPGYSLRLRARLSNVNAKGLSTGIVELDRLIGGYRGGEVTVVTGHSGSGKSTYACQQTLYQVLKNGSKAFVGSFEGGPMPFLEKVMRQMHQIDPTKLEMEQVDSALIKIGNMYIFDHSGHVKCDAFKETLNYCIERLGVKWILLDHLHFMVPRSGPDIWSQIGEMVMVIQEAVSVSDAHCMLLAHPSKNKESNKNRDDYIVQMSDLKGHTSTFQDVPNVLSLYRKRSATREEGEDADKTNMYEAALISLKQRHESGREGRAELRFHKEAALYTDTNIKDPGLYFAR